METAGHQGGHPHPCQPVVPQQTTCGETCVWNCLLGQQQQQEPQRSQPPHHQGRGGGPRATQLTENVRLPISTKGSLTLRKVAAIAAKLAGTNLLGLQHIEIQALLRLFFCFFSFQLCLYLTV